MVLSLILFWPTNVKAGPGGGPALPLPEITKVTVPPCTSPSCRNITTVIIDGLNFAPEASVSAQGITDHRYYNNMVIAGRTQSTQIIADFHYLPCSQRYAIAVSNPEGGFNLNDNLLFYPINHCVVLNSINWTNYLASLQADNFYLEIDGQKYYANTGNTKITSSSWINKNDQNIRLEVSWKENGLDLRFYLFFQVIKGNWKNYQVSVYDANKKRWISSQAGIHSKNPVECNAGVADCHGKVGTPLSLPTSTFGLDDSGTAKLHFENLKLTVFYAPLEMVYPKNGQTLDLEGDYIFKVRPVAGATGYLFELIQDGKSIYENLRDGKKLSLNGEFALRRNNSFHRKFKTGPVKVMVKAKVGSTWTNAAEIIVNLKPRKKVK